LSKVFVQSSFSRVEYGATAGTFSGSSLILESLAVFVTAASMIGLVAMHLGVFHGTQILIGSALVALVYSRMLVHQGRFQADPLPLWHFALIIGVGLFFRLPPYAYLLGGQDEGVYVNMAGELSRTGGLVPIDSILEGISNPNFRSTYLHDNYQPRIYLPGIYADTSGLEFQFYHLFPVWLALFWSAFGLDGALYSLTFLSLVSLLFFHRLAYQISGNAKTGLVAALLLAVNPLHAFFSKFPVTEIPTLAFSLMSFVFLLAYWRAPETARPRRYLLLSAAAMGLVFMTRISGFMYLPLLLVVLCAACLMPKSSSGRRNLIAWAIGCIALYAGSVWYGITWSETYSKDIYEASFQVLLGSGSRLRLYLALAFVGLSMLAFWLLSAGETGRSILSKVANKATYLLPLLLVGLTFVAAWKAYKLGYSDAYAAQFSPTGRYRSAALLNKGVESLRSVSLVASIAYLSPFVFVTFFAQAMKVRPEITLRLLLFFILTFYAYVAFLQWHLPYQPYYARYLVSEFVPYVLLFVVCTWSVMAQGMLKRFVATLLMLAAIYSIFFSIQQVGKSEHDGVRQSFERLVSHFDQADLVFLDSSLRKPVTHELKTPLRYSYGLNVLTARPESLALRGYVNSLGRPYKHVYFVSENQVPPKGFEEVDSVAFTERNYCHGNGMPTAFCTRTNGRLMIYRKTRQLAAAPGDSVLDMWGGDQGIGTLVGVRRAGSIVANGSAGFVAYGPYVPFAAGKYHLQIRGTSKTPFVVDVAGGGGKKAFEVKTLIAAERPADKVLAELDFDLPERVDDLEVRVKVENGSDLTVDGYEVTYR